jgi:CMP-2-keto-3-deoxyoctulosonic acid synthetase
MKKYKVLIVIPSRFNSSRFPGKPLKKIGNKTMIEHVYLRAIKIGCEKTIVATDDRRIYKHCILKKINVIKQLLIRYEAKTGKQLLITDINSNFEYLDFLLILFESF